MNNLHAHLPNLAPMPLPEGYDFTWYDEACQRLVELEHKKQAAISPAQFQDYDRLQKIEHDLLKLKIIQEFSRVRDALR
jgi:hypothetical protein